MLFITIHIDVHMDFETPYVSNITFNYTLLYSLYVISGRVLYLSVLMCISNTSYAYIHIMDVYVYDCLALQQVVLVLELVSGTRLSSSIALLYNSMWVAYALLYNQTILCLYKHY